LTLDIIPILALSPAFRGMLASGLNPLCHDQEAALNKILEFLRPDAQGEVAENATRGHTCAGS